MAGLELELRPGAADLLDEPLVLRVRGAGDAGERARWKARCRDDDGRVWRAEADTPAGLAAAWAPGKAGTGEVAALQSLRPVALDVRAELPGGRAAARTLVRRLAGDGVRSRRWREGRALATLHLPAEAAACAAVVLDGTADDRAAEVATLAGPLLASRGAVVLVVRAGEAAALAGRVGAVPAAAGREPRVLRAGAEVPLAPGVPARAEAADGPAARAAAWDALLAELGARARGAEG